MQKKIQHTLYKFQPVPQGIKDGLAYGVHVIGELVEEALQGHGVEEGHGAAEDVGEWRCLEARMLPIVRATEAKSMKTA